MKRNAHIISHEDWDLSRWFVILSPLIGIVMAVLGLFLFAR